MKPVQLPLDTQLSEQTLRLTIQDIIPVEYLDCPDPTPDLISNIAEFGVPPIVVCPDTRYQDEFPEAELYYPLDGKRRMKALAWLVDQDYYFADNIHAGELEFAAELRTDFTPGTAEAYRLSLMANTNRSENLITGIQAVKTAAKHLKADVFTIEGRREIANFLNIPPQVVGRYAKGTLLNDIVLEAHAQGIISPEAMKAIMDIRDKDARVKIARRIKKGESLSVADINLYNKELAQATMVEAMEEMPHIVEFQEMSENNPVAQAVVYLEHFLDKKRDTNKYGDVIAALDLLKPLA